MTSFCVFGLGEAGSEIAAGLAAAGARVRAYDPAPAGTPVGVDRFDDPSDAVREADAVIGLTAAADAATALSQALADIPRGTHYADFSAASPGLKRSLAGTASRAGLRFTDVALMGTVPGRGVRTPALASGPGAVEFGALTSPFGMRIEVVGSDPGIAATRKLLRSVLVKGLAALAIESLAAASAAGLSEEVWDEMARQLTDTDEAFLRRIITGTGRHAVRRRDEMIAARDLLEELGVHPIMTESTVASLERVLASGLPELPAESGRS